MSYQENTTKRTRTPKTHQCALCPYSTKVLQTYNNHLRSHSNEKPFKCPECPFRTKYEYGVQKHIQNVHLPETRPFPCPHPGCSYAAKRPTHLTAHSKTHSAKKFFFCFHPNCDYSTNAEHYLISHTRVHTGEKPFECQFESCSYTAAQRSQILSHTRTHTKERPYKCPEPNCGYSAAQLSHLKGHRLTHEPREGEERPLFPCPHCEYSTKYKNALFSHMKSHSLEKPFACSFESCDYRSKFKANLSTHLKSHNEERRYKCELCPYRGKTRQVVKSHLKQVHSDARPFKCKEPKCEYTSKKKYSLNLHLLAHKGDKKYSCSFPDCDFQAVARSLVKRHEHNVHLAEKKEKCPLCAYRCKRKSDLTTHMRTHTNEKPYKCKEEKNGCDYRSKQLSALKQHEKLDHSQLFEQGKTFSAKAAEKTFSSREKPKQD